MRNLTIERTHATKQGRTSLVLDAQLVQDPTIALRLPPGTIASLGGRTELIARIITTYPWTATNKGVFCAALLMPFWIVSDDLLVYLEWLAARPQEAAAA